MNVDCPGLPEELWVHVIRPTDFRREDILNIIFTCQRFRRIAQPLLFKTAVFRPPIETCATQVQENDEKKHVIPNEYLRRLNAICSEGVACCVQDLRIYWVMGASKGDWGSARRVIGTLLDALPRFSNIVTLRIDHLSLNATHLNVIIEFRRLQHLTLSQCSFDIETASLRPIVTHLRTLKILTSVNRDGDAVGSGWWLPFISASVTESLSLSGLSMAKTLFDGLEGGRVMNKLKILGLHHQFSTLPNVEEAMSRCPQVEVLLCRPAGPSTMEDPLGTPLPSHLLPNVERIAANYATLVPLLRERRIVKDVGLLTTLRGDDEIDLATLQISIACCHVRSLRLQVSDVTAGTILGVAWCFTSLKECEIIVVGLKDNFVTKVGEFMTSKDSHSHILM